jgi:hypothetical protein
MAFDLSPLNGGSGFQDNSGYMNMLPSNIPDSEKDKEYHRRYALNIARGNLNEQWSNGYFAMNENYKFYDGTQGGDEFRFLQEAEDGDVLPASWINFNKIRVKIDLLLGELSKKGFEIKVKAINKDAISRKLAEKERLRVEMRLKQDRNALEQKFGMPLSAENFVPENEEELNEYFSFKYKDKAEVAMGRALKHVAKKNVWDYTRISLFRDVLIAGRAFIRQELRDGVPVSVRVDPRNMIFDPNATDDLLRDSTYFCEVSYEPLASVASTYELTKEELQSLYKSSQSPNGGIIGGQFMSSDTIFGKTGLSIFREEKGDLRCIVVRATWQDVKFIEHKVSVDSYGQTHYKEIKEDEKKTFYGASKRRDSYQIWRKSTLIGGSIVKDWGEVENLGRDGDNPYSPTSPYLGFIPNYVNYRSVSKVEQLKGLQKLKDITMYNVQLAMSRAGAKGFIYDVSQVPDGWDVATVVKYLKTVGIGFIDSKKDGMPTQFNQFQTIDMTISSSVSQYLEISAMIDREMDAVSGINEARQGIVQSASQAVGVTQSALLQSNLSTETLFSEFEMFNSMVFTDTARLIKLVWPENKDFAMIVGDDELDWMENDIDLDLDDYGVFVEFIPPSIADLQSFQGLVQMAVQAGQLDFLSGIKLLRERDVDFGISQLERQLRKMQQMQAVQQEIQAQQEAQAQQELQAQQMDAQSQMQDKQAVRDMAIQKEKNQGQMKNTAIQSMFKGGKNG